MFICHLCLEANELGAWFLTRSQGPCEVCRNVSICFDVRTWELPNRPLISHEVSSMSKRYTPAEQAIRSFPFWNYGMDKVDPEAETAEWVPKLAAAVEAAVREQIAKEVGHGSETDA